MKLNKVFNKHKENRNVLHIDRYNCNMQIDRADRKIAEKRNDLKCLEYSLSAMQKQMADREHTFYSGGIQAAFILKIFMLNIVCDHRKFSFYFQRSF